MSVYELKAGGGLRPAEPAHCPESQESAGVLRWVRMVSPQPHELEAAIHALKLSDQALELLREDDLSSRVETEGPGLAMTLPVADPGGERAWVLRMACTATTLITVEDQALPAIDRVVTERSRAAETGLTLPGLLIEVIEAAAGCAGPVYLSLRHKLEDFADAVEKNPQQVSPEALLAIRSEVARLALLWHEQIHGLRELKRCHAFIPVTDGAHSQLRDLISDGGRGLELLSQMENRLRDLRQHQQQFVQESTNRRLNMLAILSSIYMPATLIAGIYGMNFETIPITTVSHGYYIVMAFMAIVVAGHFWYFYRRGWFK